MAKSYLIRWTKNDEKRLKHAVSLFNNKVKRLSRNKSKVNYLPDTIKYNELRSGIKSRSELNRKINSLSRFMKKGASEIKYVNDEGITAWELREARIERSTAKRRYTKELQSLQKRKKGSKYYSKYSRASMGSKRVRELQAIIKNLGRLESLKGEAFHDEIKRFHNIGTSDFDLRREIIYKENYFKMLQKSFSNLKYYKAIVSKLKEISPSAFYDFLDKIDEKFSDIPVMYHNKFSQAFFTSYVEEVVKEIGLTQKDLDELEKKANEETKEGE